MVPKTAIRKRHPYSFDPCCLEAVLTLGRLGTSRVLILTTCMDHRVFLPHSQRSLA